MDSSSRSRHWRCRVNAFDHAASPRRHRAAPTRARGLLDGFTDALGKAFENDPELLAIDSPRPRRRARARLPPRALPPTPPPRSPARGGSS